MTEINKSDAIEFRQGLIELGPNLRAFAHSLCHSSDVAEDLAQEAMLKAWKARESFKPGTSMKAWCFTILKNQFYSDKRRDWRRQPLDPEVAAETLKTPERQSSRLKLLTARNALQELPEAQREAVLLIGVGGLSYEEAAEIAGCAVGTLKSRVSRGRKALEARIGDREISFTPDEEIGSTEVFERLLDDTQNLIEPD